MPTVITPEVLAKSGSEHGHQRAYMDALHKWSQVVWEHTYAIPNGRKRGEADAGMLKAEGVKAGVPDLCIAWPFNGYHGLYIEMKKPKGKVKKDTQGPWHARLLRRGYAVAVAYTWESALDVTKIYFGETPDNPANAGCFVTSVDWNGRRTGGQT